MDWGDGLPDNPDVEQYTAAQVASLGGQVTHEYADGVNSHELTITAIDTDGNSRVVTGGTAQAALGSPTAVAQIDPLAGYVMGNTVARQASGKVVLAQPDANGNYILQRFNTDGSLDTSFGTDGTAATDVDCRGFGLAAVQADDEIVVSGCKPVCDTNGGYTWQVVLEHYNADGSLDASFGIGGTVTTGFFLFNGTMVPTVQPTSTAARRCKATPGRRPHRTPSTAA